MNDVKNYLNQVDAIYGKATTPDEVETCLKELLDGYGREHSDSDIVYASLLNELGSFYRGNRRFREGENYFQKAAELMAGFGEDYQAELATTLNNLAELYRLEGRLDEAEQQLSASLDIFAASPTDQVVPYASALNYLGHVNLDRNNYSEAVDCYERSRDLLQSTDGPVELVITAYGNLAAAHIKTGHLPEAIELLNVAEETLGLTSAVEHESYHMLMNLRQLLLTHNESTENQIAEKA
jgi:tetratricopeptide (TPR) repeat protein